MQGDWRCVGASVRGAAHERAGLPNQDAIGWSPPGGSGQPLILAVADGHGGARYVRSDVGAQLAVETALPVLAEFAASVTLESLTAVKRLAEDRLPAALVRAWRESVESHARQNPPSDDEWARLVGDRGAGRASSLAATPNVITLYGATLLATLVTPGFIVYAQLGDGDILVVTESGDVSRPLPRDEQLIANETTSLCSDRAWRDVRIGFQAISGSPPALILLSTDGYANSFRDDAGFVQVGADLHELIRADGLDRVEQHLPEWLAESSRAGSGDDITVGLVYRSSNAPPADQTAEESSETVMEQFLSHEFDSDQAAPAPDEG